MMTVVPILRIAPTDGNMPLRTFQSRAHSAASVEKRTGSKVRTPASAASIARDLRASAAASRGARLDQQRRARRAERAQCPPGSPGLPSTERSAARSASSTAATGVLLSSVHGLARGLEIVEQDQRARLVGVLGHGDVGDLADESERAFGADHQMREDVDRVLEVDQRIQAVAGRVLHAELVADARGERFVAARRARQRVERAHQVGLAFTERRAARGIARVEHGAVRPARRACPASV